MRVRTIVALLVGAAATAAAAVRVASIEPSLDVTTWMQNANPRFETWRVMVRSRGAEPMDEVAIERVSGDVRFLGGTSMKDLPAGWKVGFEVVLEPPGGKGAVRIVQRGATTRSYDVEIGGTSP